MEELGDEDVTHKINHLMAEMRRLQLSRMPTQGELTEEVAEVWPLWRIFYSALATDRLESSLEFPVLYCAKNGVGIGRLAA